MEPFKDDHSITQSESRVEAPPIFIVDDTDCGAGVGRDQSLRPLEARLLSPSYTMASESDSAENTAANTPHNPFNFQTQVISTSPVKSVRLDPSTSQLIELKTSSRTDNRP